MRTKGMLAVALLAFWPAASPHAEGSRSSVAVYYPGVPWTMRYDMDGVLEQYNNHKPGQSTYTVARGEANGILVSTQINPANAARTARDCREAEHRHIRSQKALAGSKVQLSEAGGVDMELLVPLGAGQEAVSRHVHRFWLRDGLCAKIHASKTPFVEADRPAFDKVINSVRFEPAASTLERAFAIPGRGTLLMTMPLAWGFRTSKPASATPREIEFMDPGGDYQLMMTVFPDAQAVLNGERTPRAFVETAREAARPKAVEPDPEVRQLKAGSDDGLYFQVTDKDLVGKPPQPSDFKYLRQGALLMSESLLFFSMFSNVKESPLVEAALRAVAEARIDPPQK